MSGRVRKKKLRQADATEADLRKQEGREGSETAGSGSQEHAHRRLLHLYEISKLLTSFDSVEKTVPAVIAVVAHTLPLRSAIFVLKTGDRPRTIVWQAAGESADGLRSARAHARRSYTYLVGHAAAGTVLSDQPVETNEVGEQGAEAAPRQNFVILPLAIAQRPIFGALQLEGATRLDELDLVFVNSVVNQLGVALDRHAVLEAREAATEGRRAEAEERQITAEAGRTRAERGEAAAQVEKTEAERKKEVARADRDLEVRRRGAAEVAERRVRDQLEFTRAVTGSLGEGVVAVDRDGRVTLFNAAAAQMLGWTEEDALGRLVQEIVQIQRTDGTPITAEESPFNLVMRKGGSFRSEEQLFSGHGRAAFPVAHTSAALSQDGRISGAVLAFQDITYRKQAEEALREAVEQAQRATRAREELLAIVSHDLKNPLASILMNTALMGRASGNGDRRKSRKQLESIKRAAERMSRLIQDLLDTASIDAGKLSVERRRLSVVPIVHEAIEAMQPLAAPKSLELRSELPPDLPEIAADAGRLQQVFANLLGNAIKFTPDGGTITVRVEVAEGDLKFSVTDTGSGIPEDDLPHLFQRFWQARRTARQGTGLGLSIVKGIVVAHGGRIWVESRLGVGTTVFFTLPQALHDAEEPEAGTAMEGEQRGEWGR